MMFRHRHRDDGSLPLAMLLTMVGIAATGLIGTTVVGQLRSTGFDADRAIALNTTQSGLETGLAQMRGLPAVNSDGDASAARLPCTIGGSANLVLSGRVSGASAGTYSVNVYYVTGAPPADVDQEAWAKANHLACAPTGGVSAIPMYALLASTGTAGTARRTLTAAYLFQSRTKPNVPGGTIKVYDSDQCLAAPRALTDTPPLAAGAPLILATCGSSDPRQVFTYNPTLQVELKNSEGTTSFPNGACLSAASVDHTAVTFQNCNAALRPQIWSLNNRDNFEGTTDGINADGKCFNVDYTATPDVVVINNVITGNTNKVAGNTTNADGSATDGTPCSGTSGDYTRYKTFFPDPSAGTGAAGDVTHQLVNYDQFGRCLDVTGNNVGSDFLVIFPCKQAPNKIIQWNQVWYLPTVATGQTSAQGRIYLTLNGVNYCLYSPGSIAAQQWVRVQQCTLSTAIPASQMWTRSVFTGTNQTSYRLESTYQATGSPYCLMPATPPALNALWTDFAAMHISKLVLGACDGTNLQKWNASPSILSSVVSDYREK